MKAKVVCAILLLHASFSEASVPSPKPFKTAFVFTGMTFATATFAGVFAEAEKKGISPDLIIGACGGGIAGWVAKSYPNPSDQLQFLSSQAFYDFLKEMSAPGPGAELRNAIPKALSMFGRAAVLSAIDNFSLPDLFTSTFGEGKGTFQVPGLQRDFSEPSPARLILLASQALYGPAQVGQLMKDGVPYFRETLVTDPLTKATLDRFWEPDLKLSPVSEEHFPGSRVESRIATLAGVSLPQAVKATVADPLLLPLERIGDSYYGTGAIDLWPAEIARSLADRVVVVMGGEFDTVAQSAITGTWNYSMNERRAEVIQKPFLWVDFTDAGSVGDLPEEKLKVADVRFEDSRVVADLPATLSEHRRRIRNQWEYGARKMAEALALDRSEFPEVR